MPDNAFLLIFSILWLLLCLRLYITVSRENILQRRLIAIGAGLGAGLIYIVGSMILVVLNRPGSGESPAAEVEQAEDVRIMNR